MRARPGHEDRAVDGKPEREHPKRPIEGFACKRSEVSGQRLWGLFRERFSTPGKFFKQHFVANYCPLCFMEESGRNLTPDKRARMLGGSSPAVDDNCTMAHRDAGGAGAIHPIRSGPFTTWIAVADPLLRVERAQDGES